MDLSNIQEMEKALSQFLNGVCRHELKGKYYAYTQQFLNGVCRHELKVMSIAVRAFFLNGVCRHEPMQRNV